MIVLRWLLGIVLGAVAAAVLFILAALVAGPSGGALGLLLFGFGLAFFPAVIAGGSRTVRTVVRRAAATYAFLGLLIAGFEFYQVATNAPLVPPQSFAVLSDLNSFGASITSQLAPLFAGIIGVFLMLLSIILVLMMRPAHVAATPPAKPQASGARPAASGQVARPAAAAAPQVRESPRPAAQVAPPTSSPAAKPGLDDEDAQLLADLENLRQKLPKMGKE
jgi:hypothetical protein